MHILLLFPNNSIFGKRYLKLLLDAGYKVSVIGDHDPLAHSIANYKFFRYPFFLEKVIRVLHLGHLITWIRSLYLGLIWHLIKPDLAHVHWIDLRAYECVQANLHPLVITAWGSDINDFFISSKYTEGYRQKITKVLLTADYITADTVDVLHKCEVIANKRLNTSLLYYGIDFEIFKPGYENEARHLRQELGISPEKKIILSIRALKPLYCHEYILEAFSILLSDHNFQDYYLVLKRFLDKSDKYYQQLCELIDFLGVGDHIKWIYGLPDEKMPILYSMADVVVSYPERDAFPVSFLETAACKRPMITSDLPAYQGVFSFDSFWFVPPKNTKELSNALKTVLSASEIDIQSRVINAYEIARKIGESKQCIEAINLLYSKVIKKSRLFPQG